MSRIDQIFRGVMGVGLMYLGSGSTLLTNDILSRVLLAAVGLFTIVSAITGYCSVYHFAGFNTYKKR